MVLMPRRWCLYPVGYGSVLGSLFLSSLLSDNSNVCHDLRRNVFFHQKMENYCTFDLNWQLGF